MRLILLVVVIAACGGSPPVPKRGVVEGDLGSWKFRRFQPVLDVEGWVEGNKAEAYTGTGMGLSIVQRATERMNGRLGLESEVGKGSRFWIELPAADGP